MAQQEPDIVVEGAGDEEQSDEHGQEEQRLALTLQDLGRVHFHWSPFLCFLIVFVGVDVPDILFVGKMLLDVAHGLEGRHHGVVHVVVAVLAVAADAVEVRNAVELGAHGRERFVGIEISRVGLLDAVMHGIFDRRLLDDAYLGEFLDGHRDEVFIPHLPERIALAAEVLEAEPDLMLGVWYEIRRPIVEDLQAAHADVRLLHIDPAVGRDIAERGLRRLVRQAELVGEDADRDEVAVGQLLRRRLGFIGQSAVRQLVSQLGYRHAGENVVRFERHFTIWRLDDDAGQSVACSEQADDAALEAHFAAHQLDFLAYRLPELPRAVLWIEEAVDERGLFLTRLLAAEEVGKGLADGDTLDALAAPVGVDGVRVPSPDLVRVVAEEHAVELLAKAVDHEVLEALFFPRADAGVQIADADLEEPCQAEILDRLAAQRYRIGKEMVQIADAREPRAQQHDAVRLLWIRPALRQLAVAVQQPVVQ